MGVSICFVLLELNCDYARQYFFKKLDVERISENTENHSVGPICFCSVDLPAANFVEKRLSGWTRNIRARRLSYRLRRSSTELSEGRSEYDSTVGASVRFQRSYNGKQPGDPAKAAAALLHIRPALRAAATVVAGKRLLRRS
jgi:hypothetical protein